MTEERLISIANEVLYPQSTLIGKPTLKAGRWIIGFKHRDFELAQQVAVDDQPDDEAGCQRTRTQMAKRVGLALANQRYD